jgi:beta-galactosidase
MRHAARLRCLVAVATLLALPGSLAVAAELVAVPAGAARVVAPFDDGWRFSTGDVPGAAAAAFDDAAWRALSVPHDWSIEGPYDRSNPTARGGGYLPAGVAWYRKSFTLPAAAAGRRVFVDFDGVMANSEVFLNGKSLGKRPNGYVPFSYELTGGLAAGGGTNTLAVRTDTADQPASRWYAGAGIYRHVRLRVVNPVHLEQWATQVLTPEVKGEQATVRVRTAVVNGSDRPQEVAVAITLLDAEGKTVAAGTATAAGVAAGQTAAVEKEFLVQWPRLWDVTDPALYRAVLTVKAGADTADEEAVPFGIRLMEWKPASGFWLNGQRVKLKGVCLHADGGAVGAAVPLSIWERRLAALRALGVNAVRTAHNPPAAEFLDLCDRMGFLVMEESFDTWTAAKANAGRGYNLYFNDWWKEDTRAMVLRDRNHPSVVIWSVGNEIRDPLTTPAGTARFTQQRDLINELDPRDLGGRPVTMALFRPNGPPSVYDTGFADLMDVVGQNYRENELVAAHTRKPSWVVTGTENRHDQPTWLVLRDNSFMAGQFLWTGIDYLGEADWPLISRYSGLLDRTGAPHPRAWQRQSWWSDVPMVAVARNNEAGGEDATTALVSNWTPHDVDTYDQARLQVYTNCDEVELFLNGKSLGVKPRNADDTPITYGTAFEPGTLRAVAKKGGKEAATYELRSAGKPAKLTAAADRPALAARSFDDVAVVTVTAQDDKGVMNPNADAAVTFRLQGPAELVAVDNGDRASHESYRGNTRQLFGGRAVAIVRATGPGAITVTAAAAGLGEAAVTIQGEVKAP